MSSTDIKVPKKIWVSKIEKSSYDVYDDTNCCSSNDTTEEINMFYYSTSTREEISLPNNNKTKSLNLYS